MKKKKGLFVVIALVVVAMACNNSTEEKTGNRIEKTKADSLYDDVNDGHHVGMAKMGAMIRARDKAKELLDSIAKLPAKAQVAAAPYKEKLNGVITDLNVAEDKMNTWMKEFDINKAEGDAEERIKYLMSEKLKVGEMKDAILGSLQKADSVLKAKF